MLIITPPPGQQDTVPRDQFVWEDGSLSDYSEDGAAIQRTAELVAPKLRQSRAKHGRSLLDEV